MLRAGFVAFLFLMESTGTAVSLEENMLSPPATNHNVIYTYFEHIPLEVRTTAMTDTEDEELFEFWKETWTRAGWKPIRLTLEDAKKHANYTHVQSELAVANLDYFCQQLFRKWLAMAAVGGGWYADYDVFPINNFAPQTLPDGGKMMVHDIVSPSLASGSADQWYQSLLGMLKDAQNHISINKYDDYPVTTYYVDSMAVHSLQQLPKEQQAQLPAPITIPESTRQVFLAYSRNDPTVTKNPDHCRKLRNKWAVHFSQLQGTMHVPYQYRLPKYRLTLAQDWLPKWNAICGNNTATQETTTQ